MYLKTLKLRSFRSFDDGEVELQRDLTVFAGENNGGKSNAIDAIRLLTTPISGRREIYCEQSDVRFGSTGRAFELESVYHELSPAQQGRFISGATDASLTTAAFGLRYDAARAATNARPGLWAGRVGNSPEPGCHEMIRHVYLPPLRDARRALASGNPTRIMALLSHFLEGAEPDDIARELKRQADHAILTRVDNAIEKGLTALTAGSRHQAAALGFSSDETLIDIARDLRFKLADHGVAPEDLRYSGHGYANLLYMATIAVELERIQTADLTLFLVEEPEAHLHPQLQAAVLCFLQEQAENSAKQKADPHGPSGQLQVIVATHSPNLSAWVPNEKIVVFKGVVPKRPLEEAPSPKTMAQTGSDGSAVKDMSAFDLMAGVAEVEPEAPPPAAPVEKVAPEGRRVSRCIPLSAIDIDEISRRKVDRYLDVTKAALLFGGRVFLIEGIAEALLLPVIAKKHVLKDHTDKYRIFRSAVFVPIDGVDFDPYIKLLLTSHQGIRIADRLVILTDGDDGNRKDDQEPHPGARRKAAFDKLAKDLGAADACGIVVNDYSLESELVRAGNGPLLREVYLDMHPRSAGKWDAAVALSNEAQALAIQKIFETTRKGDFAQLLAKRIEEGADFTVPDYIKNAINALVV
ncbi:AAA family ATPase [Sphingomonas aerolata]|uniref:ATP-dependent nuclease n=1 Tax=Sphingomonas aerolata TaxID=185951 RepID=UPI0033456446